jgi:hypothetical protein
MLNSTRIPHKMMHEETIDALAISFDLLSCNQIILLLSFSPKSPVPSHAPLLPSYPIPALSAVVVIRTPDPECLASSSRCFDNDNNPRIEHLPLFPFFILLCLTLLEAILILYIIFTYTLGTGDGKSCVSLGISACTCPSIGLRAVFVPASWGEEEAVIEPPTFRKGVRGVVEDDWYASSPLQEWALSPANIIARSRPGPAFGPVPQDPSVGSCFILVIISLQVGSVLFSAHHLANGLIEEISMARPRSGDCHDAFRNSLRRGKLWSLPSFTSISQGI